MATITTYTCNECGTITQEPAGWYKVKMDKQKTDFCSVQCLMVYYTPDDEDYPASSEGDADELPF